MKKHILIVDDEPNNLQVLRQILKDDYQMSFARSGAEALERARINRPNLILLDIMMPEMDGYEVCRRLKSDYVTEKIPVIFVTAMNEVADEAQGFDVGAVDYITKPVNRAIVQARVKTHLSLVRVAELKATQLELIHRLGCAAEYKDNETGRHVIRMGHYSRLLAQAHELSPEHQQLIYEAAPMHDIGKIGIPDAILQKPGPLTAEERETMNQHPEIGAVIIGHHDSALLETARIIALSHHEKWDGSGYPFGHKGERIPLEGRIVAIADVFDALSSKRPYKEAWPHDKVLKVLHEDTGKHFDPALIASFLKIMPEVLKIQEQWKEES